MKYWSDPVLFYLILIAWIIWGSSLTFARALSITAFLISLQPSSKFSRLAKDDNSYIRESSPTTSPDHSAIYNWKAFFKFVVSDILRGSLQVTKASEPAKF
jgi:hypothetical protein